jgi:hypothetical protein
MHISGFLLIGSCFTPNLLLKVIGLYVGYLCPSLRGLKNPPSLPYQKNTHHSIQTFGQLKHLSSDCLPRAHQV